VSRLPVFSGKTVRMRVPPEMVLPVFVSVIFFIALLIGYPGTSSRSARCCICLACRWAGNPIATRARRRASLGAGRGRACRCGRAGFSAAAGAEPDERPSRLN